VSLCFPASLLSSKGWTSDNTGVCPATSYLQTFPKRVQRLGAKSASFPADLEQHPKLLTNSAALWLVILAIRQAEVKKFGVS